MGKGVRTGIVSFVGRGVDKVQSQHGADCLFQVCPSLCRIYQTQFRRTLLLPALPAHTRARAWVCADAQLYGVALTHQARTTS